MTSFDEGITSLAAALGTAANESAVAETLESLAAATRLGASDLTGPKDADRVAKADRLAHLANAIRTKQSGEAQAIAHTRDVLELLA